ncbi:hypothetical protein Zmor_020202 [Zophobas morio]|uniref:Uncharacterized protein n=1 Tax=Zophobas morio TaxID=2755281 RepID=A0AA38MA33_9CUCU|nr:hypothetical protein Zmor_020202 [Zophobas morio]
MLAQQILPGTRRVRHLQQVFYIQDQISSHIARINVVYLNQYFSAILEWKVCTAPLVCAIARSKPLRNFFFGDFFTTICIQTSYTNREALKQAIQQYCLQISTKMLINTRRSFEDRLTYLYSC